MNQIPRFSAQVLQILFSNEIQALDVNFLNWFGFQSVLLVKLLSEKSQCFVLLVGGCTYILGPPGASVRLRQRHEVEVQAGIVDCDVDSTERFYGLRESGFNIRLGRHVRLVDEDLGVWI